jgi:hypothetical protein
MFARCDGGLAFASFAGSSSLGAIRSILSVGKSAGSEATVSALVVLSRT